MNTEDGHNYFFGSIPEMPWKRNIYNPRPDCQIKNIAELYMEIFGNKTDGLFVEVGANDGVSYSNTVFLAELGWFGLYIEPVRYLYEKCVENHKNHPNITVLNVAVGKGDKISIYKSADNTAFTGHTQFAEALHAHEYIGDYTTIQLNSILGQYVDGILDLLVVDVEGMEMEVLESFSLDVWLPTLAIIETHAKRTDILAMHAEAIDAYFSVLYTKVYEDEINTVYKLRRIR